MYPTSRTTATRLLTPIQLQHHLLFGPTAINVDVVRHVRLVGDGANRAARHNYRRLTRIRESTSSYRYADPLATGFNEAAEIVAGMGVLRAERLEHLQRTPPTDGGLTSPFRRVLLFAHVAEFARAGIATKPFWRIVATAIRQQHPTRIHLILVDPDGTYTPPEIVAHLTDVDLDLDTLRPPHAPYPLPFRPWKAS